LNFGTDWASDFTIILPKRVWALLQERGLGRAALTGRRIRARGILEERQGPALVLTAPEAVETMDEITPGGRATGAVETIDEIAPRDRGTGAVETVDRPAKRP
jgi:hypothetical protein